MTIHFDLKNILICPDCRSHLKYETDLIKCLNCKNQFLVQDGIPVMFSKNIKKDSLVQRYLESYKKLSQDDLKKSIVDENIKEIRYESLKSFLGDTSDRIILDIGSSQGLFSNRLKGNKVALDISLDYLKTAKEEFGISAVAGFGENLPFKDDCFDVVICADVLEHVLYPEKVTEQAYRVLSPKGFFLIEVPYKEDLLPYKAYEDIYEFTHLRSFDFKYLEDILKKFKITKREFHMYRRATRLERWINKIPNFYFLKEHLFKPIFIRLLAVKK